MCVSVYYAASHTANSTRTWSAVVHIRPDCLYMKSACVHSHRVALDLRDESASTLTDVEK